MIKRIFKKLGYEIYKSSELRNYPYVKDYELHQKKLSCWIPDQTARLWYDTEFEKNLVELEGLQTLLNPQDSILEFGVHYGFYGSFLSSIVRECGKYLGIELDPKAAMYAQSQMSLNHFPTNCRVINAAGGEQETSVRIASFSNGNSHVGTGGSGREIRTVTGDALAQEQDGCTLLKIDVEGYETEVLRGCKQLLLTRPKIALEIHAPLLSNYGKTVDDVLELLNVDVYEGAMYRRPELRLEKFDVSRIDPEGITNLFLKPRQPATSSDRQSQ